MREGYTISLVLWEISPRRFDRLLKNTLWGGYVHYPDESDLVTTQKIAD